MMARHASRLSVLLGLSLALGLAVMVATGGCEQAEAGPAIPPPAKALTTAPAASPSPVTSFADVQLRPPSQEGLVGPDIGAPITPRVKPYAVDPGLKQVANLDDFSRELDAAARRKLAKNLFVVTPAKLEQFFYVYEANEEKGKPSFVTLDSMLHLWHMTFDYTLRYLERTSLQKLVGNLTREMLSSALKAYSQAKGGLAREAAARAVAYFAVPARLLALPNLPRLPAKVEQWVKADLKAIEAHAGTKKSAVTGFEVPFSLFKPRGHYTRSTEYKRLFKAMSWYGNVYWPFPEQDTRQARVSAATAALLWKLLLGQGDQTTSAQQWRKIDETVQWFVGGADDTTPQEMGKLVAQVYGPRPSLSSLGSSARAAQLLRLAAKQLPAPLLRPTSGDLRWKNMRFMGTRFIPDAYIHHNLVWNRVGKSPEGDQRLLPRGLDVFAALGSSRALDHLTRLYRDDRFAGFKDQMVALRRWLQEQPAERWVSNMYWGWFWVLSAVAAPKPEGYPSFMLSDAWTDKQLATALASWAELRHDTILYAKQVMAEGEGPNLPPMPKGYVEPDAQAWRRLYTLADLSLRGLLDRGLLSKDDNMADTLGQIRDTIGQLGKIAEKELSGVSLTDDEYQTINWAGDRIESLQLLLVQQGDNQQANRWFEIPRDEDRRVACIADVATGGNKTLEVAVGPGYTVYVICPVEGKLVLTKGAVFSYFEFPWPASDRLTDEQWNQMLDEGKAPEAPRWQASFLTSLAPPAGKWQVYFGE